jgi:AraC-like DNA-binding protein
MQRVTSPPLACYREFVTSRALQSDVSAIFSFIPGSILTPPFRPVIREVLFHDATYCSPQFADGHVSVVFELGRNCDGEGRWHADASERRGTVVGPMSAVGRTEGRDRPEMLGIYFRPARVAPFLRLPLSDFTDIAVAIDDVWGSSGARLAGELCELDEAARVVRIESELLARRSVDRSRARSVDLRALGARVLQQRGRVTVESMAQAAGVSRQHLSRQFREQIGVGPKLYSRLARFHASLAYAGRPAGVDWAQAALDMGYADQSHMIAEFRQFSGLTPRELSVGWFHPFIERARARHRSDSVFEG